MSGPSATANPMSAKIAVNSSVTWLIGWTRPTSVGGSRTGSVTSTLSILSRAARARSLSTARRAAMAAATRSFTALICAPLTLRSSGVIVPSVFSSSETAPFLPSAPTRTASSAASSVAAATAPMMSFSNCSRPDIDPSSSGCLWRPGLEKVKPCRARSARSVATASEERDCGASGRQRGFGLTHDRFERRRLADGEVGQHLAIDHDPGLAEAADKSAVGQAERAHRRVEALDPQRPERALPPLAVAIGVLVGALYRLLGDADRVLAPAVEALGGLEDLLVLGVRGHAPFDAGHG